MTQYINNDALVAEIKRLIECCYKMCAGDLDFLQKSYPEHYYSIETYKEILSFVNTLEVKEVDLEKELRDFVVGDIDDYDMGLAKHFYELGLKAAQKGE